MRIANNIDVYKRQARMVARDLVSLENRPKLILIVGLLVVDGVRVKQYMYS